MFPFGGVFLQVIYKQKKCSKDIWIFCHAIFVIFGGIFGKQRVVTNFFQTFLIFPLLKIFLTRFLSFLVYFWGKNACTYNIYIGIVKSKKMERTIIVRRDYLHWIQKYQRYEKRHKNVAAHISPCFRVNIGDVVTIGQCRPLSKTVRFNVVKVER